MKNKNVKIGSWITIYSLEIVEIMADAGFEWLCVDMEHSAIDYSQAKNLILTIQSKGIKAYVRVGENNARIIKRVLDSGADGIIIPSVNSEKDAKKAVESVFYPPNGKRGGGLARAQGYGFDFESYREKKKKKITIIVQIEHINAINEIDAIIKTDGIDGTIIGPYDLSSSLGVPGKWNDPKVKNAIKKYENTAILYDKLMGFHVVPPDYKLVNEKIKKGYNFIAFGFEGIFLGSLIREQLKKIKL